MNRIRAARRALAGILDSHTNRRLSPSYEKYKTGSDTQVYKRSGWCQVPYDSAMSRPCHVAAQESTFFRNRN